MKPQTFHYDRLVKSEDLNHHGTLFAGRSAEWFVEAGFIAAASVLPPKNIVCTLSRRAFRTFSACCGTVLFFPSENW